MVPPQSFEVLGLNGHLNYDVGGGRGVGWSASVTLNKENIISWLDTAYEHDHLQARVWFEKCTMWVTLKVGVWAPPYLLVESFFQGDLVVKKLKNDIFKLVPTFVDSLFTWDYHWKRSTKYRNNGLNLSPAECYCWRCGEGFETPDRKWCQDICSLLFFTRLQVALEDFFPFRDFFFFNWSMDGGCHILYRL